MIDQLELYINERKGGKSKVGQIALQVSYKLRSITCTVSRTALLLSAEAHYSTPVLSQHQVQLHHMLLNRVQQYRNTWSVTLHTMQH